MKNTRLDDDVPVYVTSLGHRYVKVNELLKSPRVRETIKEMGKLANLVTSKQSKTASQD